MTVGLFSDSSLNLMFAFNLLKPNLTVQDTDD